MEIGVKCVKSDRWPTLTPTSLSLSPSTLLGKRINNRWMYEMYLMLRTVRAQLRQLRGAAGGGRVSFRFVCFFYVNDFWTYLGNWWPHRRSSGRHPNRRQLPEWQRCKHREEQTKITDYNRDEQQTNKSCHWLWYTGQRQRRQKSLINFARNFIGRGRHFNWKWQSQRRVDRQSTRERERSRWADRRADRKTGQTCRQTDGQDRHADSQT